MKRNLVKNIRQWMHCLVMPVALASFVFSPCKADWINNSSSKGKPFDAIVGGYDPATAYDNPTLVSYLCRAYHNNDVQPGYVPPGDSVCHFSYGGLELTSTNFDWYVPSWINSYGQAMPANAIPLGAEPVGGSDGYRYSCRVNLTPGKYGQDFGACYFPYGGLENHQPTSGFSWLVDPGDNVNPPPASSLTTMPFGDLLVGPYLMANLDEVTNITGGVYTYTSWPPDAIVAGLDADGTPLYVCTGFYQNGMQPGKARRDWDACDVGWGGSEHYIGQSGGFFVLMPAYVPGQNDFFCGSWGTPSCKAATNLVPVGIDSDGSTLYSCRALTNDGVIIAGKFKASMGGTSCSYARYGVEYYSTSIENTILTDGLITLPQTM